MAAGRATKKAAARGTGGKKGNGSRSELRSDPLKHVNGDAASTVTAADDGCDFRAMLAEAAQQETLRLLHSAPASGKAVKEALDLAEIPGKGRGYRALRPIRAGELLIVAEPLVFVAYTQLPCGNHRALVDAVLQTSASGGAAAALLAELCGADARGGQPLGESAACEILRRNCCASPTGVGLWHAPSFLNHADDANATRIFIADWLLVRARRDIPVGEEVTLAYTDPCSDPCSQLAYLQSLGIEDAELERRAQRWTAAEEPRLLALKASASGQRPQWPGEADGEGESLEERGPLSEKRRYLRRLLGREQGAVDWAASSWCWGQLVQYLRNEMTLRRELGELCRAQGASLAAAELLMQYLGQCPASLEAWADSAALLFDTAPSECGEEHGDAMELCVDGMQSGIEFVFGERWAEDADFSTLVLSWATARLYHAAAWARQTAAPVYEQGGAQAADAAGDGQAISDLSGLD